MDTNSDNKETIIESLMLEIRKLNEEIKQLREEQQHSNKQTENKFQQLENKIDKQMEASHRLENIATQLSRQLEELSCRHKENSQVDNVSESETGIDHGDYNDDQYANDVTHHHHQQQQPDDDEPMVHAENQPIEDDQFCGSIGDLEIDEYYDATQNAHHELPCQAVYSDSSSDDEEHLADIDGPERKKIKRSQMIDPMETPEAETYANSTQCQISTYVDIPPTSQAYNGPGHSNQVDGASVANQVAREDTWIQYAEDFDIYGDTTSQSSDDSNGHTKSKLKCPHCAHVVQTEKGLAYHVKRYHPEVSLECTLCPYTTVLESILARHVENDHAGNGETNDQDQESEMAWEAFANIIGQHEHQCTKCGNILANRKNLKRHIIEQHLTPVKKCPHCDHYVRSERGLTSHIQNHHPKFLYVCPHCPYTAVQVPILNRHVARDHSENGTTFQVGTIDHHRYNGASTSSAQENESEENLRRSSNNIYTNKARLENGTTFQVGTIDQHRYSGTSTSSAQENESEEKLRRSSNTVNINGQVMFECNECGRIIKDAINMTDHIKWNHMMVS